MTLTEKRFLWGIGLADMVLGLVFAWVMADAFGWRAGVVCLAVGIAVGSVSWFLRDQPTWMKTTVSTGILIVGVVVLLPLVKGPANK